MNNSRVTEEVNRIKTRPNLLLWYTADEPDGTSDPLNATVRSYQLINSLDGGDSTGGAGYHPVSLVLNCQDHEFRCVHVGSTDVLCPCNSNIPFPIIQCIRQRSRHCNARCVPPWEQRHLFERVGYRMYS
jgi:hypothetical protein